MPNKEELISKFSANVTESDSERWMSKIDLEYAYDQAKISKASKHCILNNWRQLRGTLPFQDRLLRAIGHFNRFSRAHLQSIGN